MQKVIIIILSLTVALLAACQPEILEVVHPHNLSIWVTHLKFSLPQASTGGGNQSDEEEPIIQGEVSSASVTSLSNTEVQLVDGQTDETLAVTYTDSVGGFAMEGVLGMHYFRLITESQGTLESNTVEIQGDIWVSIETPN